MYFDLFVSDNRVVYWSKFHHRAQTPVRRKYSLHWHFPSKMLDKTE